MKTNQNQLGNLLILWIALMVPASCLAAVFPDHFDAAQGSTVEINIPRVNSSYIEGIFEGEKLLFQKIPIVSMVTLASTDSLQQVQKI
jgi:hypothetical protein